LASVADARQHSRNRKLFPSSTNPTRRVTIARVNSYFFPKKRFTLRY
jgi:hypothetical protein